MNDKIDLLITCSPGEAESAALLELPLAMTAYGIWRSHLFRHDLSEKKFDVMCIDGRKFNGSGSHSALASEITREAILRSCRGILLDLPPATLPALNDFCMLLSSSAALNGMTLYLPERFASQVKEASALVRTALCSGSLRERLLEVTEKLGSGRTALDVEVMSADFTLPSRDGAGRYISPEELAELLSRLGSAPFFSNELCARYFIYRSENDTHFVLFDDAKTVTKKFSIAGELGIRTAFIRFSDMHAIADGVK